MSHTLTPFTLRRANPRTPDGQGGWKTSNTYTDKIVYLQVSIDSKETKAKFRKETDIQIEDLIFQNKNSFAYKIVAINTISRNKYIEATLERASLPISQHVADDSNQDS
ncbi:MAG: hypothetical protein KAS32_24535 [Candidatus Peribacteraceae bacterium]|nr:hypothetical protein [Candidatus Peribacteraceae bacterium]